MSSSYDAAVVDVAMIDDPRQLMVSRGVRLLYLEALVWAKVRGTDGYIPTGALTKLTDEPDPESGAAQLVMVGLWEAHPLGWQIADFADTQMTAARVKEVKAGARERYDRWRTKEREKASQRVGNATTNGAARPAPPARKGGGQVGGGAPLGLEPAAAAEKSESISCAAYSAHQSKHRLTSLGWVCDLCERRKVARLIREAPNPSLKGAYSKVFAKSWGHLYGRAAA